MKFAKSLARYAPDWRTVLSGFMIVVAFPPWDMSSLIWIALIPWFSALDRSKSMKSACLQSFWLGFLMSLGGFYWIASVLIEFAEVPTFLGILGLLLYSTVGQAQLYLFTPLYRKLNDVMPVRTQAWRLAGGSILLALAYTGIDWILPKLFVDTFGHALYNAPRMRQVADIGGPTLLTFMIFLMNHSLWLLYKRLRSRSEPSIWPAIAKTAPQLLVALSLCLGGCIYGHYRGIQIQELTDHPIENVQMAVIQANIGDFDKVAAEHGMRGARETILGTFYGMSDEALAMTPKPNAVIWPETSYPSTFRTPEVAEEMNADQRLETFVRSRGVPLYFGGYDRDGQKDYNAFFFLSPHPVPGLLGEGDLQIYRKNMLLMFGEVIPGAEYFNFLKRAFPQVGNFGRGVGPVTLDLPLTHKTLSSFKVGPIICYEALFPNYVIASARQGSQMILNITNDSWFGPHGEPYLHLALIAFRGIETRLPQLRSTNTGISTLILPNGEITHPTSVGTKVIMNVTVPLIKPVWTLMLAWGDWFGPTSLIIGLGGLIGLLWSRSRRRATSR